MSIDCANLCRNRFRDPRKAGFTITELLVVIAAISLLLGLMLHAVTAVRSDANRTVEMAAARSLGVAWAGYAMDNRGRVLPGYASGFRARDGDGEWVDTQTAPVAVKRWPLRLATYLSNDFASLYPGALASQLDQLASSPTEELLYSVSVHPAFGLNSVFVGGDENYGGFSDVFNETFGDFYVTGVSSIKRPENLVVFATTRSEAAGPTGSGEIREGFFRALPPAWLLPLWSDEHDPETAESSGFLSDRHREADGQDVCIVTTADGGVATETIEELRDMRRWSNRARNQTDALQPQGP